MMTASERADLVRRGAYGQYAQQAFQECLNTPLPHWGTHTGSATNDDLILLVRAAGQLAQQGPELLAGAIKRKTIMPTQVMDAMELLAVQRDTIKDLPTAMEMASAWESLWNHQHIKKKDPSGRQRLRAASLVDMAGGGNAPIRNAKKFLDGIQDTLDMNGTTVVEEGFRFLVRCSLEEISPARINGSRTTPKM